MTVDQWLAANGGPRRFEPGASSDFLSLKIWLAERGWEMNSAKSKVAIKRIGKRGRPTTMTLKSAFAFVDDLRVAEGLQPLVRRDVEQARKAAA